MALARILATFCDRRSPIGCQLASAEPGRLEFLALINVRMRAKPRCRSASRVRHDAAYQDVAFRCDALLDFITNQGVSLLRYSQVARRQSNSPRATIHSGNWHDRLRLETRSI